MAHNRAAARLHSRMRTHAGQAHDLHLSLSSAPTHQHHQSTNAPAARLVPANSLLGASAGSTEVMVTLLPYQPRCRTLLYTMAVELTDATWLSAAKLTSCASGQLSITELGMAVMLMMSAPPLLPSSCSSARWRWPPLLEAPLGSFPARVSMRVSKSISACGTTSVTLMSWIRDPLRRSNSKYQRGVARSRMVVTSVGGGGGGGGEGGVGGAGGGGGEGGAGGGGGGLGGVGGGEGGGGGRGGAGG